jgi:hypothetical protein
VPTRLRFSLGGAGGPAGDGGCGPLPVEYRDILLENKFSETFHLSELTKPFFYSFFLLILADICFRFRFKFFFIPILLFFFFSQNFLAPRLLLRPAGKVKK